MPARVLNYFVDHYLEVLLRTQEHFIMVIVSMCFAILIGVPLGILFSRNKIVGEVFIYFSSIIFTIPSLALFGLLLPLLSYFGKGIGAVPAVIAVVLYSLAPIVRNTYSGINNIDRATLETADGMGMSRTQRLFFVELPMALSTIVAGIKISVVLGVATITIGTYIGAGGLGLFISRGISQTDFTQVIVGAILVSALALFLDFSFSYFEKLTGRFSRKSQKN